MPLTFQTRKFNNGRQYRGFIRGDLVLDPSAVKPGELLIEVNKQFQAENLLRVVEQEPNAIARNEKFYAEWLFFPKRGKPFAEENFCVWDFRLKQEEFHRAVKVPVFNLDEVDTYTADELRQIMVTLNGESTSLDEIERNMPYYREHVLGILVNAQVKSRLVNV